MVNNKVGFNYYNVDTDRYQDIKIKRLKKVFSCAGIAVYDYLLCEIYRVKGCFIEWDESRAFDVAEYFGIKESLVNEIVKHCFNLELFNKELFTKFFILSSEDIQRKYVKLVDKIDFNVISKSYFLIDLNSIPKYKTNPKSRMYQHDIKKWISIVKNVFERDNYVCQYCGAKGKQLECDHIVPFSKGGSDDLDNLTTSCRRCNRQKKDKSVDQFKTWKANIR
jgi:hypothetical protein